MTKYLLYAMAAICGCALFTQCGTTNPENDEQYTLLISQLDLMRYDKQERLQNMVEFTGMTEQGQAVSGQAETFMALTEQVYQSVSNGTPDALSNLLGQVKAHLEADESYMANNRINLPEAANANLATLRLRVLAQELTYLDHLLTSYQAQFYVFDQVDLTLQSNSSSLRKGQTYEGTLALKAGLSGVKGNVYINQLDGSTRYRKLDGVYGYDKPFTIPDLQQGSYHLKGFYETSSNGKVISINFEEKFTVK